MAGGSIPADADGRARRNAPTCVLTATRARRLERRDFSEVGRPKYGAGRPWLEPPRRMTCSADLGRPAASWFATGAGWAAPTVGAQRARKPAPSEGDDTAHLPLIVGSVIRRDD